MSTIKLIKPKKTFSLEDIREIWQFKELFYFLTWRDIKVRYKQTVIGIAWSLFQPFVTMVIFTVFFGHLAKMPSDGIPYPIFVYTGLLLWQFFSGALGEISNCLITNTSIITKVYFPRLILPISATITKFVDFLLGTIILLGMMIYYHYLPSLISLIIIPLILLITFITALGFGLFLAAVNVRYRDVRYALPFFIQIMMYVTPVIYPTSIAGKYAWILALNPMTGIINATRAAVFGNTPIDWLTLGISTLISAILTIIGIIYFKKVERIFADIA